MKLKEMLIGNLALKLLAVLAAIGLWIFIAFLGQSETTVEAQIDFRNIPAGLEILKQSKKRVSVSVRAHEMILSNLKPTDLRVIVDLSSGKKGEATYSFDANDVKTRQNVKVLRVEPSSIRVALDELESRKVQLVPAITGEPAAGYEIKKITIEPAAVMVEGAKTEMARFAILKTEPLDITGMQAPTSQSVRIDTSGRSIRPKTADATVKVIIGRKKN